MTWAYFSVSATWNWRQPRLGEDLGQAGHRQRRKCDRDRQPRLVLGHRHDVQVARTLAAVECERVELIAVDQGVGELTRAIGAEVEVDDHVAVADRAVDAVDDRRLDELVVLATGVAVRDGLLPAAGACRPRPCTIASYARCDTLPALVAVHAVVATADGCDPRSRMSLGQARLEVGHELVCRARRRVATVEQSVDHDVCRPGQPGQARDLDSVPINRVDATGSEQADEVESAPGSCPCDGLLQRRVDWQTTHQRSRRRCAAGPARPAGRRQG